MTKSLVDLGLSSYEAAAYVALLRKNGSTPTELANKAGIPRQRIYDVLATLSTKGFCFAQDTNPKTYYAVDPAIALPRLTAQREEEFRIEMKQHAERSESLVATLAPIFEQGSQFERQEPFLEIFNDHLAMAARSFELLRDAKRTMFITIRSPFTLSSALNSEFVDKALEKGISCRALFGDRTLENPIALEWARKFIDAGHEVRIGKTVPVKLTFYDDNVVLLTMKDPEAGPPTFTSLVISHPETVLFLREGFDRMWTDGTPYAPYGA